MYYNLLYMPITDSTQSEAMRLIDADKITSNTVIIADVQTAGYGTSNRTWNSKSGNIYMTLIIPYAKIDNVSIIASALLLQYIHSIEPGLTNIVKFKPINDLYANSKKLAGLLCQYYRDHILFGVGLNVTRVYDSNVATCLNDFVSKQLKKDDVIEALIQHLLFGLLSNKNNSLIAFANKHIYSKVRTTINNVTGYPVRIKEDGSILLLEDEKYSGQS